MRFGDANKLSLLDLAYRAATNNKKFFSNGIGDKVYLESLFALVDNISCPAPVEINFGKTQKYFGIEMTEGTFISPQNKILPAESRVAHLKVILPENHSKDTPVVLHMAGTGDIGFKRREVFLAIPLAKQGIGSIILESPYYGLRKPHGQEGMYILEASDLFKMVHANFEEGRSIIDFFKDKFKTLGVTGFSMGGQTSMMIGFNHPSVKALIPCVAPHSPIPVFLEETLKDSIDWHALELDLIAEGISPTEYLARFFSVSDMTTFPRIHVPPSREIIAATGDAYVPKRSSEQISIALENTPITWLNGGHVSTLVLESAIVREKIKTAMLRAKNLYT